MPKKLPSTDFRAVRTVLEASDFAYAPGPRERPARDLIDEATWEDIQTLPETVSIFTSNDHGKELSALSNLWGKWVEALQIGEVPPSRRGTHRASLVATDEFQAATFNALHGFYRIVADSLRSAVEQMTIGVELDLTGNAKETARWLDGTQKFLFGKACDSLQIKFRPTRLRRLFQQGDGRNEEGWIRAFHRALSDYSHARPGFGAVDMWEGSNGPIYVSSAFVWSMKMWLFAYATCVILLKVAQPETPRIGDIFSQKVVSEERILMNAARFLWSPKRPSQSNVGESTPSTREPSE
jgi:hypothetical protein